MNKPYKILVVDDEPDLEPLMLQRMRRHIRAGRYSFVFARNGLEALDRLNEEGNIDMVLSDINMPQMDGLTLLEQIPKVDPNIRSVIISAYGDMKNIRTAMNRGAFDFVTKPVDFKDLQITIERTLAHMMEWREALSYRDKLVSIQNELEVASRIPLSILPSEFPDDLRYQVYGNMEPARDVGGDFFDIMLLDEGQIGLAIADVSDKGVPAALFMMSCRTLLKGVAIGLTDPGAVLGEVNDLLHEDNETMLFVTVLYAVYNPATGEFTYASGGHDAPLLIRSDGTVSLLPLTDGIALGVAPELEYKQHKIELSPGDTVVLYTDGVTEAQNTDGSAFQVDGLHQIFAGSSSYLKAREGTDLVFEKVREFMGEASQFDDITCLTLHRDT